MDEANKETAKETGPKIRYAEVGNRQGIIDVDLGPGATVKDLLKKQNVGEDREIRVNNEVVSPGVELQEGDLVTALPRVVGG